MIINLIQFKPVHQRHINTFNGRADHWDGSCSKRTALRGAIRRHYLKEQDNYCAYCGRLRQDFHGYNWDIDHIIPKSTHPHYTYEPKNFAITCKECNISKDNKNVLVPGVNALGDYPYNLQDYTIVHPHLDNYSTHLTVRYTDKLQIYHKPITSKGLETFNMCGLERFTEIIANTSEFIKEEDITIGFSDDDFNSFYEGFQRFASLYTSDPTVQSRMYARFLAEQVGIETDSVLEAIETLRTNQLDNQSSYSGVVLGPQILPLSNQEEE